MKSVYTGGEKVAEFENYNELRVGENKPAFIYEGNEMVYPNPVKDGLVLWYDFAGRTNTDGQRGIAEDLSGNGNHGTLQNFNYTPESGYDKNKLLFDGVDDVVRTDGSDGKFRLDNFTVEWVGYSNVNAGEAGSTFHLMEAGYNTGWALSYHVGNQLMLSFKNSLKEDGWNRTYLSRLFFNRFYTVFAFTGVFTKTGIKCYVNGEYLENGSIETNIDPQYSQNHDLRISNNLNGGTMSSKVYNRPLTPEEVAHNYAIEKERFGIE